MQQQFSQAGNYARQRTELYNNFATDLDRETATFLLGGSTSQSLKLSDLFQIEEGKVRPVLKEADPAVRAAVLYMDPQFSRSIFQVLSEIVFLHFSDSSIWRQDPMLYHFSMFHASHHVDPVPATKEEIESEAAMIRAVASHLCPSKIALQRVVLMSTGVLLGLWEVVEGPDPAVIRSELKAALPRAPNHQFYNSVLLHSSFARILGLPLGVHSSEEALPYLKNLAQEATSRLAGWPVELKELWFVEERDVLALALNGRMVAHKFPLACSS